MTIVSISAIVYAQEPPKMWVPYITPTHALEAPLSPIELPPQMPPEAQNALVANITTEVVSSTSPEKVIRDEAKLAGVDENLMVRVSKCESGLNPKAVNPSGDASGLFQYLGSTFKTYCIDAYHYATSMAEKNDVLPQVKCAVRMVKEGEISHWSESSHCHRGGR